jgi:hypothetical protein
MANEGTATCLHEPASCVFRDRSYRCMVAQGGGKCPKYVKLCAAKEQARAQGQMQLKFEEV